MPKLQVHVFLFLQNHILSNRQIRINMKKRNEDNHDNLGEPDDQLPAEVLKKLNELLERLHGWENLNIIKLKKEKIEEENNEKFEREKSVQINIYEKGSQHIDTQINWGASPPAQASPPAPASPLTPLQLARGTLGERGVDSFEKTKGLPEVLATEEAMRLWEKGRQAGYVDECYQPLLSRTQSALLADAMAERLGIKEKWKVFEELWHRKYMRNDYNLALTQRQSYKFQDDLKQLFG